MKEKKNCELKGVYTLYAWAILSSGPARQPLSLPLLTIKIPLNLRIPFQPFIPLFSPSLTFLLFFLLFPVLTPGPMDARRRPSNPVRSNPVGEPKHHSQPPLFPLYVTNAIFFSLFFSVAYFLLHRWRDKIRTSTPLHFVTLSEIAAILSLLFSFFYLISFFGIGLIFHPFSSSSSPRSSPSPSDDDDEDTTHILAKPSKPTQEVNPDDEAIVNSVVSGSVPSYSLESKLGDCNRAATIRRTAVERVTSRSLEGLPVEGFDYESILGQCCEMPIGYVQIPVGVAGPLLLDGKEYTVPMATTEGCLVASTNRGCKAIHVSGGASSVVLRDSMTRAPVVRFGSIKRAAQLKFYLEDPDNFDSLSVVFNK